MQYITNEELTNLTAGGLSDELSDALRLMTVKMKEHLGSDYLSNEDIDDVVEFCLIKSLRFNPERGKAFNYFTTTILCQFAQIRAMYRNKEKLAQIRVNSRNQKVS